MVPPRAAMPSVATVDSSAMAVTRPVETLVTPTAETLRTTVATSLTLAPTRVATAVAPSQDPLLVVTVVISSLARERSLFSSLFLRSGLQALYFILSYLAIPV